MESEIIKCSNCETKNSRTNQFCSYCGLWLQNFETLKTFNQQQGTLIKAHVEEILKDNPMLTGTVELEPGMIALIPQGYPNIIKLEFEDDIILGRDTGVRNNTTPLIDFNDYRGYVLGVSRQHAIISHNPEKKPVIKDLGSSNGTFINDERLKPNQPYEISDGDVITLGQLKLKFFSS